MGVFFMNANQLTLVKSFLRAFAGIEEDSAMRKAIGLIRRNKRYLWQFPNEGKCVFLEGREASEAFDYADKTEAFEFVFDGPFSYDGPIPLAKEHLTSALIKEDGVREFYVFGKKFEWCYVVTHEGDACGPFFFNVC